MNNPAENNSNKTSNSDELSKSDLLQQLKIDRTAQPEPESHWYQAKSNQLLLGLGAIGIVAVLLFSGESTTSSDQLKTADESKPESIPSPVQENQPSVPPSKPVFENEAILNGSGYITARRMATVSAEIMGLITSVQVEEGMEVKQGDVLATLDSTLAKINLDLAKAQLQTSEARKQSVEASLREAERQYKRVTSNSYSSESAISSAQTNLESLQANLASELAGLKVAKLEVQRQQERFNDHTIRAPFDGVVTVKNAQTGEIVAPSSAGGGFTRTGICTIVDMNSLEIEVDVNESFIGRVFAGQKVKANLDAYPDWDIPATVTAIIPTADRAKATVRVRIGIDLKDPKILPDMGVKVAFLK